MTISQPKVSVNIVPAVLEVGNTAQKVLIVGQKIGGTATAGALVQNIQNDHSEEGLFGETSLLCTMIREFKKLNPVTQVDAISLADAGGAVAATAVVAFTGPATAAGTINVVVGSAVNNTYAVPVASSDSATTIGAALASLINADDTAPFTANSVTGTCTITAANKGTEANAFALSIGALPAGVGATLTGWTGGATDPTLTALFDVVGTQRYQTVVWPGAYALTVLKTWLDARFNVSNQVLDGVAIYTQVDSASNFETALASLNSQSLCQVCVKKNTNSTYIGGSIPELPCVISAQIAAIRSLRLTQDADISQYTISTNGALDSFGGPALASFPYFNTPLPNLPLEPVGYGWSATDQDALVAAGGSVLGNNVPNSEVIMGPIVTTYKTDSDGNADPTFTFLEYVDTASNAREYFFNNLRKRFAQSRLTEGDLVPNRSIANADVIASYVTKLYGDLSGQDWVLTQAGAAALAFFKSKLSVTLDMVAGKATVVMQTPIVTQLRSIIATMQIAFSTGG